MQEQPITPFPITSERKKRNLPLIIIIIIVIFIVTGWFYLIKSIVNKKEEVKTTPTEIQKPTPTTESIVDKKIVKIQILNGTGTPGQASEAVKLLVKAGYVDDNIKTGNAEEFNKTTTTIAFKKSFEKTVDDIKKTLKEKFEKILIDSTELNKDDEYDIIITTGGKIYNQPTSTIAPTTETTETPTPTLTTTLTPTPTH